MIDNTQLSVNDEVFQLDDIAVLFHHKLVLVHTFPNGNGRHARLMTDSLLSEMGGRPIYLGQRSRPGG